MPSNELFFASELKSVKMQNLTEPLLVLEEPSLLPHLKSLLQGYPLLVLTILLEASGTLLMKKAWESRWFMTLSYFIYFTALYMFLVVLRTIPLSVAYSIWCVSGVVLVSVGACVFFDEEISTLRWVCIILTLPLMIGICVLE